MTFNFRNFLAVAVISTGMAACSGTGVTSGGGGNDGLNRVVQVKNLSGRTVFRFYGSRVSTNSWEEDILGNSVLSSGSAKNINFDDGTGACNFDFRVVFADGGERIENNINVSSVSTFTIR